MLLRTGNLTTFVNTEESGDRVAKLTVKQFNSLKDDDNGTIEVAYNKVDHGKYVSYDFYTIKNNTQLCSIFLYKKCSLIKYLFGTYGKINFETMMLLLHSKIS